MKKRYITRSLMIVTAALLITGCSDKEKTKSLTEGGMKCGAGKCGANMADGGTLLDKKRMNILNQMRKEDTRRDCVLKAKTTKGLYDCVRDLKTGRITTKCSADNAVALQKKNQAKKEENMKCEAGKCTGN